MEFGSNNESRDLALHDNTMFVHIAQHLQLLLDHY